MTNNVAVVIENRDERKLHCAVCFSPIGMWQKFYTNSRGEEVCSKCYHADMLAAELQALERARMTFTLGALLTWKGKGTR